MFDEAMITQVDDVKIINTTMHPITFQCADGSLVVIPPTPEYVINAEIDNSETHHDDRRHADFVTPRFNADRSIARALENFLDAYPDVILAGSLIAAQAYPRLICAMIPVPGFERVPPDQKRMDPHKWTEYAYSRG